MDSQNNDIPVPTIYAESVLLDGEAVRILDRRIFPFSKEFVVCRDVEQVARAIEEMVTQSNGPFYASGGGMVLAARLAERELAAAERKSFLEHAARQLIRTRPTNNNIATSVAAVLAFVEGQGVSAAGLAEHVEIFVRGQWEARRAQARAVGGHAASLLAEGEKLLTHCWSEGALIETLAAVRRAGKAIEVLCTETRPYLQGARLTAHSVAEMGISATVITDGMVAHAMASGRVSMLMTAADRVTMSGHVINKVGTLNAAIAARHFRVPYFVTVLRPDERAAAPTDVEMEERNGEETLSCLGHRTASQLAKGWYPAFDVTPPELVSGLVTEKGIFPAAALTQTFPR